MYSSLSNTRSLNFPVPECSGALVLDNDETEAILQFLQKKPAHCAYLTGLIQEHGPVSRLHRGIFYASRNFLGELRGIALVGHATIIEPNEQRIIKRLGRAANKWELKNVS